MPTKILIQTICPNCIALHVGKQGARSAEVGALVPAFQKSVTELKSNPKLLRCKNTVHITAVNVRIVNRIDHLPELRASTTEHYIDILWIQEDRYYDRKEVSSWLMVKALDCGIVVSEFVLQSRYYVHFRTNTLGKGMNPFILPAMG